MIKKIIILAILLLALSACTTGNGDGLELPTKINQWAIAAEASDSYGGLFGGNRDDQSPFAATGEPDVTECGENQRAWVISQDNDGLHWLELSYDKEVYVSSVKVIESFNPGAVVKIELKNDSDYFTLWEGSYKTKDCSYTLEKKYQEIQGNITSNMTSFSTDKVRITVNTDVAGWNEIDAVELAGYEQKWHIYNDTLVIE
ncbi:MAG: hypothetical protein AABW92_00375 [Nanoarchaeota archaeon]